jgi:hypothetical protein
MTREEVVNFLCDKCNCYKKDIKTINLMIEAGRENGYLIIKKGVDSYDIREACAITDFTKPLKVYRNIPLLAPTECYNGVPIGIFYNLDHFMTRFNYKLWCYLANKNDNDYIYFSEFDEKPIELAKDFDCLASLGYLREKDDCLEFYLYPLPDRIRNPGLDERLTPLKYL